MAKGSVHLRKDGRWEGRIVVGYSEEGCPKAKNVLAKTKRECQKKLRVLEKQCTPVRASEPRPEMSFGQWMDHWYRTYCQPGIRPNTRTAYEAAIYRHILPEPGGAEQGGGTGPDPGQPRRGVQAAAQKDPGDAGSGPGGTAAAADPVKRGRLLRAPASGALHGAAAGGTAGAPVDGPGLGHRRPADRQAGWQDRRETYRLPAQDPRRGPDRASAGPSGRDAVGVLKRRSLPVDVSLPGKGGPPAGPGLGP